MPRPTPETRSIVVPVLFSNSSGANTRTNYNVEIYRRTYSSVNTPRWNRPKKWLAPFNDYQMYLTEVEPGTYSRKSTSFSSVSWHSGGGASNSSWSIESGNARVLIGSPAVVSHDIARLLGEASREALLNLKSQKVNLGQVYGERSQTLRMIRSSVQRISLSFSRLKRFDIVGAAHALNFELRPSRRKRLEDRRTAYLESKRSGADFAAASWLEYVYGWRPLLQDVHGSLEKWADYQIGRPPLVRVIGTSKESISRRIWHSNSSTLKDYTDARSEARIRVIYEYTLGNQIFHELSSFGVTNPLALAWELLPYSFVVDWFLPIGDFLSSLDAEFGMSFVRGVHSSTVNANSTRSKGEADYKSASNDNGSAISSSQYTVSGGGSTRLRQFVYTRTRLFSSLPYRLPTVKDPFSVHHTLNSLALLKVAFGR